MSSSTQGRRALVTGSCGFSGARLIDILLKKGWSVRATDLKNAPRTALERFGDEIEFIAADLTERETLKATVKDIDVVYHPAALFSYSAPIDLLRKVNVEGTKNLIESCIDASVGKMVMWSSVATYGTADKKWYSIPITEDQEYNPKSKANMT